MKTASLFDGLDVARSGAVLSPCQKYRYLLWRGGDMASTGDPAIFIMLNPSTADAQADDPTIRRCGGFARTWGCNGFLVLNLYALRATNPRALWAHGDPVGAENDEWLARIGATAREVVCAWGAGARPERVAAVVDLLGTAGVQLRCLGITRLGAPRHPLYLRSDQPLCDWSLH